MLVEELSKKGKKEATLSFDRRPLDENEARIVAREAEHIKEKYVKCKTIKFTFGFF